jgi:hypothetical protein
VTTRTSSIGREHKTRAAAESFSSQAFEDATARERTELLVSAATFGGTTLVDMLYHGAEIDYDPAVSAQVRARIRLRRRLDLPHSDCGQGREGCDCLRTVLDAGGGLTPTEALQAARAEHRAKWPRFKPLPRPPKRAMQTPKPKPVPKRPAKKLTEAPTRPDTSTEHRSGIVWVSQSSRDKRSTFADIMETVF